MVNPEDLLWNSLFQQLPNSQLDYVLLQKLKVALMYCTKFYLNTLLLIQNFLLLKMQTISQAVLTVLFFLTK